MWGISSLADEPLAFEEELCCMKLFNCWLFGWSVIQSVVSQFV
jgi:hypothetical protein